MFGFGPVFSAKIVCRDGVTRALERGGDRAREAIYKALLRGGAIVQRRAKLNVKQKFGHVSKGLQRQRGQLRGRMRRANKSAEKARGRKPFTEAQIGSTKGPSGELGRSIIVKGDWLRLRAVIGPTAIHGRIHELGGIIRPRRAKLLAWWDPDGVDDDGKPAAVLRFARKVTIPKRPYLRPAADVSRPQVQEILRKAVARWAEKTQKDGAKGGGKTTTAQTTE